MQPTFLFITSAFKGMKMLQAVKELGVRVWLITEEKLRHEPWDRNAIDEIYYMPDLRRYQDIINAVSYLCRENQIERIIPLDEFEVEIAAMLREHLRLPGMTTSQVRIFRDKLAMRDVTNRAGLAVPPFVGAIHYPTLSDYMANTSSPWMLKPRMEAGAMGITKCHSAEEVWQNIHALGDKQSYYLLEQFMPGDVFHVDSIVVDGQIQFVSAQQYGLPPMDVYHGGGVFTTKIVDRTSQLHHDLLAMNSQLIGIMQMQNGITHAEFIRSDGKLYFLEVAARVGGSFIADLIEQATGLNPWREWGRLEYALYSGEAYTLPAVREDYGGLLVTLSRQEHPDLSSYNDPEVVWRGTKAYHAALIAVSPSVARVDELMNAYAQRFAAEFTAVGRPEGATRTGHSSG